MKSMMILVAVLGYSHISKFCVVIQKLVSYAKRSNKNESSHFQNYLARPTNMISLQVIFAFTFTSSAIAVFFGPPAKVSMTSYQNI